MKRRKKEMTKFAKTDFNNNGGYVTYGTDRKFVARFKYAKAGAGSFIAFLIKNFTVEEYFAQLEAGIAPLKIVEEKGYLLPHIKTWLKRDGYEVSKAGYEQYITDRVAKYRQAA
jgi:hypothetical protein